MTEEKEGKSILKEHRENEPFLSPIWWAVQNHSPSSATNLNNRTLLVPGRKDTGRVPFRDRPRDRPSLAAGRRVREGLVRPSVSLKQLRQSGRLAGRVGIRVIFNVFTLWLMVQLYKL